MKTAIEIFKECTEVVDETHQQADASERLRATLALTELTMRGVVEAFNQKRWEESQTFGQMRQGAING